MKKNTAGFKNDREIRAATHGFQMLPIPALIATMNMMIDVLRIRGFEVWDWDHKDKVVYKLTFKGGKIYALIIHKKADPPPTKEENNDEPEPQHPGG